ncbi:MAG: ATP-binding protein, partial [Bacteroidota bacterium]
KKQAVSKGLLTEEDAGTIKDQKAAELLFTNGFSTAEKVDNYAGRGQGLGIVKTIVEEQEGSLNVRSKKGEFFEIKFKLPLVRESEMEKAA